MIMIMLFGMWTPSSDIPCDFEQRLSVNYVRQEKILHMAYYPKLCGSNNHPHCLVALSDGSAYIVQGSCKQIAVQINK